MLDYDAGIDTDRRPRLLVARLALDGGGAEARLEPAPLDPQPLADATALTLTDDDRQASPEATIRAALSRSRAQALLLTVPTSGHCVRVHMRAENRAGRDATSRLDPIGPAVARVTLPVAEIVAGLKAEGLEVEAASDPAPALANAVLYRLLTRLGDMADAPLMGLLALPASSGGEGTALKTVLRTVGRRLSPFSRLPG